MEDLLIIVFQIIGQIIFELLAYMPWDLWWWPDSWSAPQTKASPGLFWWWILVAAAGAAIGWASLLIFPDVMVKFGWLRIALLIISPLSSGFIAKSMADMKTTKENSDDSMSHFWFAFCFSLGLVVVRFALAHRPA